MFELYRDDCLAILPILESGSVDLVLCDPPYGTTACAWDSVIPLAEMWTGLLSVAKPNAALVFTASQPFTSVLVSSNLKGFRQSLVWTKNKPSGHLNAKRRHLTAHEDILIFSKRVHTYNPQKWESTPSNFAVKRKTSDVYGSQKEVTYAGGNTLRYPTTVKAFSVVNNDGSSGGRLHPTQKPVALMEYLIQTYSNFGDTVLDFTMGSGTTGVAAANTGRKFIGIEKDEGYFEVAKRRIEAAYSENDWVGLL